MSILRREIELAVQIGDEPTEMSAVGIIAWHPDIEVLAMRSYCGPDGVVLLLITTNAPKAADILEAAGFRCKSTPVILAGPLHQSGLAALIGTELALLGIDVLYSYTSRIGAGHQYLVFKTADDNRALQALEAKAGVRDLAQANSWQHQSAVSEMVSSCQQAAA